MPIIRFKLPVSAWSPLPPMPDATVATGAPMERGVELFAAPTDGLTVGLWECSAWTSTFAPYPFDEVMVLLEGSVTIALHGGAQQTFCKGDVFFLPKGLPCAWEQSGPVRKIYVIYEHGLPLPDALGDLRVDPVRALSPTPAPAHDVLVGPAPEQRSVRVYTDASARFTLGVWSSSPYARIAMPHPKHELMHLLQGSVTLAEPGADPQTFHAGETFFVPQGTRVSWQSTLDVRKVYCMIAATEGTPA